ncbi:MAG: hypothetical protein IPK83_02385 [Planctomycetes bacterium]|nr:hypothetical protein [Planctomycetota bacterium]
MAIGLSIWRFDGEPPSFERIVEAFRVRYDGEVTASFDSHVAKESHEDMSEEESRDMQVVTQGLRFSSAWRTATIMTSAGRIELHCSAGENLISARLYTFDVAVLDALDGAMASVGGAKRQSDTRHDGSPRPAAQPLISGQSKTLINVFAYTCYAGIATLLLMDKVGFLGAFGLLVLTWMLRFALTLAIGIRRARSMFTEILQRMPTQQAGETKSVESRVVESTEVKPQN